MKLVSFYVPLSSIIYFSWLSDCNHSYKMDISYVATIVSSTHKLEIHNQYITIWVVCDNTISTTMNVNDNSKEGIIKDCSVTE